MFEFYGAGGVLRVEVGICPFLVACNPQGICLRIEDHDDGISISINVMIQG